VTNINGTLTCALSRMRRSRSKPWALDRAFDRDLVTLTGELYLEHGRFLWIRIDDQRSVARRQNLRLHPVVEDDVS